MYKLKIWKAWNPPVIDNEMSLQNFKFLTQHIYVLKILK